MPRPLSRYRRPVQLNFFHRLPERPQWATLPSEVKEKLIPLLARFLKKHHPASLARRETTDE